MIERKAKPYIAKVYDNDGDLLETIEFVGHEYALTARIQSIMRRNQDIKETQIFIAGKNEPHLVVGYND